MATTTNYLLPNGTDIGTLFQPFTSTSTSIFSTTQILSLATNSTGSILAGVAKNSATMYYSSDSGTNWGTAITLPITATHIAISDNGTYQLICGHNSTYNYYAYSTSGGGAGTWTAKVMPGSTGLNISVPTGVAISSNGQYMYVCGDTILLYSQNYAGSFTTINNLTSQIFTGICCSSDGKYVYTCSTLGIKISTNNGSSWSNNSFSGYFTNICCNSSGNVVMVTEYNVGTFISINNGATWTKTLLPATTAGFVTRGASGLNYTGYIVSCSNSTGQYLSISFYSSGTTGNIYTSYNYGKNWFQLNSPVGTYKNSFLATNSNRSILYLTDLTNIYKYTFSPLANVNYMNIDGTDLSQLFVGYTSGNHVQPTGYLLTNGTDLNTIFQGNPNIQTSSLLTSILTTYTNLAPSLIIMPYGYNYFNFYLYGAGGNGQYSNANGGAGGGGGGAFIKALQIPYLYSNICITNINYIFGTNKDTIVNIYYSNGTSINLTAGKGKNSGSGTATTGGAGGIPTFTNTTTFYLSSNITTVSGKNGGDKNNSGSNNGYTSSGSGINNNYETLANNSGVTNIFTATDGKSYTITSYGGGSNQLVSGYGSGGATSNTPPGDPKLINGTQGVILYTLSK